MGEIPECLMAVAADVHDGTKDFTRFAKIHHVAEAIIAERKRCAEVVRQAKALNDDERYLLSKLANSILDQ